MPGQQLLLEGETPVRLGSRAFAILTALVGQAGEVVGKDELMSHVWPNTTVDDINLRVNVAALRKALGDGQPGRRYVANVTGRGYRFVAPVEHLEPEGLSDPPPVRLEAAHNLPPLLTRPIGRADTVGALVRQLSQHRLLTVVGPGGIGKTTVALAAAETLLTAHRDGVRFVNLAPIHDPQLVPSAVAAALGLTIHGETSAAGLIAYLRDKQMLIVLDSCEHCVEAASSLAEQLIGQSRDLHILATSREPLRCDGERVRRLQPLASPLKSSHPLTAAEALGFPAVQLFVERAAASRDSFELTDTDAPIVADICRKLDGIALAIELAAARTNVFSIRELSTRLEDRLQLLQGRRTAVPRHRTLAAALDWSYEALWENERRVLRRLSVFVGTLTLEAAAVVAAGDDIGPGGIVETLSNLVDKSLVSADVSGPIAQYRLLDTTRAYAHQKLTECGERETLMRRHAEYHRDLFRQAETEWEVRPTIEWAEDYGRRIDDVRSALDWAFSAVGDATIGVALTVAALPLWSHLSLMEECRRRVELALAGAADERGRSTHDEMKLYSALAAALLHATGPLPETDVVWARALETAERLADGEYQLRALWGLSAYHIAIGDYRAGLALAEKFRTLAGEHGDIAAWIMGGRMTGAALHYLARETEARQHLQLTVSQYVAPIQRSHLSRFQFDQRALAKQTLSSVLWLQGFPDQAVHMTASALEDARAIGHGLTLCSVLFSSACTIALYVGDLAATERFLAMLEEQLAKHTFIIWNVLARCMRSLLLVEQGDIAGLTMLRSALDELRHVRFVTRYPAYLGRLAQGLGDHGLSVEALSRIEEALAWADSHEERWCIPELLRIKGDLLLADGPLGEATAAEACYEQALEAARRQEALSWELRVAMSLARLRQGLGKREETYELLSSIYYRFGEGFETRDLRTARALMDKIQTEMGV
jgi:predicted ATPase/DNA-binding winged helix-turn-helix (wHTH) protein